MAIRVFLTGAAPATASHVQFDDGRSWNFREGTVEILDRDMRVIAEFDRRAVAFVKFTQDDPR